MEIENASQIGTKYNQRKGPSTSDISKPIGEWNLYKSNTMNTSF